MRFTKTGVAAVAVLLLTVAALPGTAAAQPLDRYYGQHLAWESCVRGPDDASGQALEAVGGRCAEVVVPLDYARPRGRTVSVAMARVAATDTAHRIGALVVNEGGPGDGVIDYLSERHIALGETAARFDLVGVDPRFTGRNAPLDCGWRTATYFRSAGADRAGFDRMVGFERELAGQCGRRAGDLLPYASTRNAARDMDVVRGVLGQRRISYLGISYGTYLGEVYATVWTTRRTTRTSRSSSVR